jgi:hypothetical protein
MASFFPVPQNSSLIDELEIENSSLITNNEILPEPIGIASTYIAIYELPASKLDKVQEMYDLIDQINQKKQQIVNICNNAFNNGCSLESNQNLIRTDGKVNDVEIVSAPSDASNGTYSNVSATGGSGTGATFNVVVSGGFITSVSVSNAGEEYSLGDTLTIKANLIGIDTTETDFDLILQVIELDDTSNVVSETGITYALIGGPPPIFTPIAYGVVREDSLRIFYQPDVENPSTLPSTDNTANGLIYPVITSGSFNSEYRGKGRETLFAVNATYNEGGTDVRFWDDAGNWSTDGLQYGSGWKGSGNVIGRYYKIRDNCEGRADQIDTLQNEILALREQVYDYLQPINVLKRKRYGYLLSNWSYRRNQKVNNDTIEANNSLIDLINDPSYSDIFE